jgi:EAL domain-containing protein (putative c-di-GMP-specific phosphodiesterase class I)
VVESEEIASYQQMIHALKPFRAIGCGVAIDDFGSGYANFAHVSGLQADILKIDGSLVQAMAHDVSREVVVQGLIEFAHRMGMKVVAEFVSTPELWQRLAEMGVDGMQGFAISHPIDEQALNMIGMH